MLGEFTKADNFVVESELFVGYFATELALNTAIPKGKTGQFAIVASTGTVWNWNGSAWVDSLVAGSVTSVNGKTGVVVLVKGDIGLGNVTNTSDADKPVSTAQQTALDGKIDKTLADAYSIIGANVDDTPIAIAISTNSVVGRVAGNIVNIPIDNDLSSVSAGDDTVPSAKATKTALDGKISNTLVDANTVIGGTADNTPIAIAINANSLLGRIGANIVNVAIDADLSSVSANDDTVPSAKATKTALDTKLEASLFDAQSILIAKTDDTPEALVVGTNTVVGRIAGDIQNVTIQNDVSGASTDDDTVPSTKAVKTAVDLKADASPKIKFTPEGGLAILMKNKTGGVSVKGTVVEPYDATAIDEAVAKIIQDDPDPIGVIYEAGIADGSEVWVVISGIAEVLFVGNTTRGHLARGFITADGASYEAGKALSEAIPSSPFATDKHFYEIGHVLASRTGAGLAKVCLHFN